MRTLLVTALLLLGLTLNACASRSAKPAAEPEPSPLAGTSWIATDITGQAIAVEPAATLTFEETGEVFGNSGCNNFFGQATFEGNGLKMGPFGTTRMACAPDLMDREQRYFEALGKIQGYDHGDNLLLLLDNAGQAQVRFKPAGAP